MSNIGNHDAGKDSNHLPENRTWWQRYAAILLIAAFAVLCLLLVVLEKAR
ncbi:MAG TPA: hypothetical protein PLL30_16035 [Candidatus Krumholzibacteria bacterium]|nr:hypothetical protein [Candidatus Krumholzibacteria bacterium]HPD73280.1 hypothetical protein [Candidatus Krumholzibacteria bacterium]HRY40242.1 hypothetical protein [Candidatus Krumholzibacteria bacterium]